MACVGFFDSMKTASESLGKEVHRKATFNSVWLNALPKGSYPLGTGLTQTGFKIENSLPVDDELAWQNIQNSGTTSSSLVNMDSGDGLCGRSWNDVDWGFSEYTFNPQRVSVRGPQLCKENLKYRFNLDSFLNAYVDEISKHSKRILENKIQNEYMKHARQVTLAGTTVDDAALSDSAVGAGELSAATLADSVPLLQAHLDQLAIKLIESGATEGDSNGFVELGPNGPIFPLIIGMETSNALINADDNLRQDYRHGAQNSELLKRIGADRVVGNFRHIVVTNPVRMARHASDGTYDRVSERVALSGGEAPTKGNGTKINPLYTAKTGTGAGIYETAIALTPSVMKQLVVPASVPASLGFDPTNYSGDWKFVVGGYKSADGCADELEYRGRHYGTYEMAFEPIFGEHGATVLFKRNGVS
jgi:hypothetical protein